MVGFVHFSNFLIPSEKYYKLQSCWITLYFVSQAAMDKGMVPIQVLIRRRQIRHIRVSQSEFKFNRIVWSGKDSQG